MKSALLEEAKLLPIEERIELVEAIWDTVGEAPGLDALPLPEAHRIELDRRLADLEAHPDEESPWDEVLARLERAR